MPDLETLQSVAVLLLAGGATVAALLWLGRAKTGEAARRQQAGIAAHREHKRRYREALGDPRAQALADLIRGRR